MSYPKISEDYDTKEVFTYLDRLRISGITNMFGATPYVVDEFNMSSELARKYLVSWMEHFKDNHKVYAVNAW